MQYRKPKSGRYKVELAKVFTDPAGDVHYRPGRPITVDQAMLDLMIAAEAVDNVTPA